jgi:hypothetical protein
MQNLLEREEFLSTSIEALDKVNKQLAKLSLQKEGLTEAIIAAFGHQHEGQRTYDYQAWKVEIKTPIIYSLNKKLYESTKSHLPEEFNPVKESVSYSIDKRLCDHYIENSPTEVKSILVDLIDKKPGKASISIKERV